MRVERLVSTSWTLLTPSSPLPAELPNPISLLPRRTFDTQTTGHLHAALKKNSTVLN